MQNGIIINGVKYEARYADLSLSRASVCGECAIFPRIPLKCPGICSLFDGAMPEGPVYFVKLKDRPAITKEEAAKRIAGYVFNNPDKFTRGDTKEVLAEINKLL